ncbi:MAG TPA: serine/threonine-protein kinase [Kofleriaceae bacterium]|nr:serine/threonine-protein kinase [Kofleriaceae bacterium]
MLGAAIGRFRIQARLGRGGFGEVWLAQHEEARTKVAIKLFNTEVAAHPAIQLCFDEARLISRVAASGIAKVYDANVLSNGVAYLITEYVEGEALDRRIARGRHSATQLADIIEQTATALVTAANVGVTHANLKPSNIFVVPDLDRASGERVVVVDFAHAKLMSAMPDHGNPTYMAPEQIAGAKYDWRVDAYSLGCVAFELGCQRPVFTGDSWDKLRSKHQKEKPPNLRSFVPDASAALDRLIARMLEKNPAERPKSMKDIAKLFQLMVGLEAPLGETVKD